MLTPSFYARYRVLPSPVWWTAVVAPLRAWMRIVGHEVVVEDAARIPARPALLCTNSSQRYDFLSLRPVLKSLGRPAVTVTKGKNYHAASMAFVLRRTGVVPLISRGYLILVDFVHTVGRRPTDAEYRALRDHLDTGAALPDGAPFDVVTARTRDIVGHRFDPSVRTWRDVVRAAYEASLAETVRLAREAVDAGLHVHMYPEGTVSPRLGRGRNGAVQLARALGIDLVPMGMSGCPAAYAGETPLPRRGRVVVRVGEPLDTARLLADLPASFRPFHPDDERAHKATLDAATARLMTAIEARLDEDQRALPDGPSSSKGTRAFL